MTRYEKQEQIYQDILSVKAELDDCPQGSPQWFELHDRLHCLCQAYIAVPQDPPSERPHGRRGYYHELARMFRPHLWMMAILMLITAPWALAMSGDDFGMGLLWIVSLLVFWPLAVWAST